jgi:putative DNA primase/helicase
MDEIVKNLGSPFPPDFKFDGTFFRFGEKNRLWAVGVEYLHGAKKESVKYASYGDWKTGQTFTWCNIDYESRSAQFKKTFNNQISKTITAVNEEKIKRNQECAQESSDLYNATPESTIVYDYLIAKNVKSNYIARISKSTLIIPVFNHDEEGNRYIAGLQKIYKNPETFKYDKRFTTGIKKQGSYILINDLDISLIDYANLCEGYATGCTIFEATGVPTICCIDSGNMHACVATLRQINPGLKLIICADDDFETKQKTGKNPGIEAAHFTKRHFSNIIIKIPKFKARINETDFNDLATLESLETVANQLVFDAGEFCDIDILGHENHTKIFMFCTQSLKTVEVNASQIGATYLTMYATSQFWATRYSAFKKDAEGNQTDQVNWQMIVEKIAVDARKKGDFSWLNVRGTGVWNDNEKPVINLGNRIYIDNQCTDIGKFRSEHKYQSSKPMEIKTNGNIDLLTPLQLIRYKRPADHILLAGWIAIAPLYNLLEWRPHLWINGERGTGKSTLLKMFQKMIWNSLIFIESTASGIRQDIKCNAQPVIVDEAEPDSREGRGRMDAIIEMIRQSSTNGGARSVRGTVNGDSRELNINGIFMLGSIVNSLENKSDISRFTVIDLGDLKGQTAKEYDDLKTGLESIDAASLMMQSVKRWEYTKKNIEIIKREMREHFEPRQCDQIAPLLAGHYSLISTGIISPESIDAYLDQLDLSNYKEDLEESEYDVLLEAIHSAKGDRDGKTIGQMIEENNERDLRLFGIKPIAETFMTNAKVKSIRIMARNEELAKVLPVNLRRYSKILQLKCERKKLKFWDNKAYHGYEISLA